MEISFPGGCFNPPYSKKESNITEEIVAFQTQKVSKAIFIKEDPGTPFYFKCDAKKYMGIMQEVKKYTYRISFYFIINVYEISKFQTCTNLRTTFRG